MKTWLLLLTLLCYISPRWSWAQTFDICDTIFKSTNYGCQNRASSNTMGGSYAMLFDAFNANPASIPINVTPWGVEYTNTQGKSNFALIKGQDNWGAGFSAPRTPTPPSLAHMKTIKLA